MHSNNSVVQCPAPERLFVLDHELEQHIDGCGECRAAVSALAMGEAPAATFGRYRVEAVLGSGGMGIVYGGWDPLLERAVAIKVVRNTDDEAGRARLVREAQSLARLSHRNVCQVYDAGSDGDEVWVAMERIDGVTLREYGRRGGTLIPALLDAADGLAAAHAAGIVHRDVKPENVLVARDGRGVVTDFGLARVAPAGELPSHGEPTASTLGGTPAYLAPEQLAGAPADARSDQYAWAVTAWELLVGERPVPGVASPPRAMSRHLASALRRALSQDPESRFSSMNALTSAIRPRKRRWLIALAASAALATLGAWMLGKPDALDPVATCELAADRVDAVWNAGRAAELRRAFVATNQGFAAESADRVAAVLDRYAIRFRRDTVEACQSTFVHREASERAFDLQSECLAHGLARVDQLIEQLSHPDRETIVHAIDAAHSATSPGSCRDVPLLLAREEEPTDPRTRAAIAGARAKLDQAAALDEVGRPEQSLAVANDAAAVAETTSYNPLRAEAAYRVGVELRALGDIKRAEPTFQRAAVDAEAGRDDRLAASAWTRLMSVAGARADYDEALRRGEQAAAKLQRIGNPPDALGYFYAVRGSVESARGDLAGARTDLERALSVLEPLGVDRPRVVSTLGSLARVYGELGRHDLALVTAERAARLAEEVMGPDHPSLAAPLQGLAFEQGHAGRHQMAIATLERVLAIRSHAFGDDAALLAGPLNDLAGELVAIGDTATAEARLERALAIDMKALGQDHPATVGVEINLASLEISQRPRDAIAHLEHALAVRIAKDPESTGVALALTRLADAERVVGERTAARKGYARAIALFGAKLGADHPHVAMVWHAVAQLELEAGNRTAAVAALEHAVAIDDRGQREPDEAADDRFLLAQQLGRQDPVRARALAVAARDGLVGIDGGDDSRRAIEAWLAAHPLASR